MREEVKVMEHEKIKDEVIGKIVETIFGFNQFDRFEILKQVHSALKKDRDAFVNNQLNELSAMEKHIEEIKNLDY